VAYGSLQYNISAKYHIADFSIQRQTLDIQTLERQTLDTTNPHDKISESKNISFTPTCIVRTGTLLYGPEIRDGGFSNGKKGL
jgi:hypothetical protein